ncbi:MAG: hypothetical protein CL609_21885 [Anaerolineaceae bacterium]|nr:hypothetical protein [Anaerolineaceae bacterium]
MADKKGIPLTDVKDFPPEVIKKLAQLWITTVEELVGAAIRENGPAGLGKLLGLPVEEVIRLVDLAQDHLPAGVSFSPDEVQRFGLGALDEPTAEEPPPSFSFAPLPSKVDLIKHMAPIRNQKQRGTCVAFACTAVREYLLPETIQVNDLSEQYLYWNCKEHDLFNGPGTYIHVAMNRLLQDGQCREEDWPYNGNKIPNNEGQGPPPEGIADKAVAYRIEETQKLPARSVNHLRQSLAEQKPIAFAVPVYEYWFSQPLYSSGDIRLPLPDDKLAGGHAMCMVGYEDDPDLPGGGFFMIRNSWGTDWAGESTLGAGYARLPYAYMEEYGKSAHTAAVHNPVIEEETKTGFIASILRFLRSLFGSG